MLNNAVNSLSGASGAASGASNAASNAASANTIGMTGMNNIVKGLTGAFTFGLSSLLDPKSYKAGDNTSKNIMRNIINTNLI